MRIHRVEIENLASLQGEQPPIDLVNGDLGQAGLVAITGATGAGKSTILDAVSLALFDRTPRLGGVTPRELMSRGAGEAKAAVELELDDGQQWRLEWSVRRAYGKPGGAFQPSSRRLLDIKTGELLADKKTDVADRIGEHLDLDFDQFTGVILLAQGDFAKFLQAGDSDRAELLEKLTGTEIYSRLSIAAHERRKERQSVVEALEQRLQDQQPLPQDERHRLAAETDALGPQRAALDEELHDLQEIRRWLDRFLVLRREHAQAMKTLDEARRARDAFADERQRLERGEAAASLAMPLEAASGARRNAEDARKSEEDARKALGGARAIAEERAEALVRELALLDAGRRAVEDEVRRLQPFGTADNEEIDALRKLRRETAEATVSRQRASKRIADLETKVEELETRRERLDQELEVAVEEVASGRRDLAALAEERDRLSGGGPFADLVERRHHLSKAVEIHDELVALDAAAVAHRLKTEKTQKRRAETALKAARGQVEARRRNAEEQARVVELALVRAKLVEHRPLLTPGEPCPLCGAEDHPWADLADEKRNSALRAARQHHDELRQHLREAESEADGAAEVVAEAAARMERAKEQVDATEREITRHRKSWRELRSHLTELPESPLDLDHNAWESEIGKLEGVLARLQEIQQRRENQNEALEIAEATRSDIQTRRAVLHERLSTTAEQLETARAAGKDAEDREQRAAEQLRRRAADLAKTCGLRSGVEAVDVVRIVENAETLLHTVLEGLQALQTAEERSRRVGELERGAGKRGRALLGDREIPDKLAEPTEPSLAELATAVEEAVESAEQATKRRSIRADRLQGAEDQRRTAEERRQETEAALRDALVGTAFGDEEELRAALLDADALDSLRRRRDDLRAAVERADATAERAERDLLRHLETVESHGLDREAVEGEGANLDAETSRIDEELGIVRQRLQEATDRKMELDLRLRQDAEIRRRREALGEELETARAVHERADRLHDLIGHNKGVKFRLFAQKLNLDQLLELANLRLDRLAPRYNLERVENSLEIRVIDREMADERRPVNTLSGGETFLVSLSLALALADLRRGRLDLGTLFLDEGFGSLDEDTLDTALDVLAELQARQATQILIISHVGALQERIAHRIEVEKKGGGRSRLAIRVTR